ncbi:IPT/TIG domain-containing protein [Lutispora thermophila]|uniref:IPT/TIG domain-containing protein n=1 Tax=Lutispora thermophila DSM 19022 TaxID=1122184 RepID=A0A1M6BVV9_9FIRM|nr:IPT/TIG domain-containing protein [Lutispora thermophila]SHI52811.1 IPT/TIG domain-containing protein [Lutispora thermophila DSM 19022]
MSKMKRKAAILLAFIMIFNMLPISVLQVHAYDPSNFRIETVTIYKIYDSNRNIEQRKLLITGSYLKDAAVGILTYANAYSPLTKRTVNTEGILQFDLENDQLGNEVVVEGVHIQLNENQMPTLTGVNRRVKEGKEELIIQGTNLNNIGGSTNITAGYEHDGAYTPISATTTDPNRLTITNPTGPLGLQNIIFEKTEKITKTFNPNNKDVEVTVKIIYTYKDQFRLYQDIEVQDLKMYPNRGQKGDKVYFEAPAGKLDSYDVYFLRQTDGTDPYKEANKGKNKTFQQNVNGKDILTVEVPDIDVGEYYVVFTNAVSAGEDPMNAVTKEKILTEKFTVISAFIKSKVISINPKTGPDTGSKATISAQFVGTLNIPEFTPDSDDKKYTFRDGNRELVIDYATGSYNNSSGYKARRTIRIIIGDKATFLKDSNDNPDVEFKNNLDIINIRTAQVTDADVNPTKDVVIEMETVIMDSLDQVIQTITDRAVLPNGYTYIPSKTEPLVESIVPEKIQVKELDVNRYSTADKRIMIAIYGKNFMVHKYTDASGKDVVRYPIVELGPDLTLNPNAGDADYTKDLEMKVLSSTGVELDGSSGNEIGTKILFYLPANSIVRNIGKTYVTVINPIRNSNERGLYNMKVDAVEFVTVEENKEPIIAGVNPDTVSVDGGVEVKITGNNFMEGVRLFLDGKEITNIKRDEDGKGISFIAPAGREGTTQILVMNPTGGSATWHFNYVTTYTNPKITDFEPKSGNTGTLVVIKGENFIPPDPTDRTDLRYRLIGTRVLLGNTDINDYNLDNQKKIVLEPYEDPEGKKIVSLKKDGDLTSIEVRDYYYSVIFVDENRNYYTLTIDGSGDVILSDGVYNTYKLIIDGGDIKADKQDGFIYDFESNATGITITDKGTKILKLTMETPYKVDANKKIIGNRVKVVDKNTIYIKVPALPADGYYDVTVVNPDTKRDSKTGTNGFYYFSHPQSKPKIEKIVPNEGTTDGGYSIDIEGNDFMDIGIDKAKVYINGIEVPSNDIEVSPNGKKITVRKVPAYPGDLFKEKGTSRYAVPVVVVNPDGGSDSMEKGFTYIVPTSHPQLIKIVPAKGTAAGGEVVEITGTDFRFFEPYEDKNRDGVRNDDEPFRDINGNKVWDSEANLNEWLKEQDLNHPVFDKYLESPILPKVFFGDKLAKIVEFSRGYLKVITPEGTAGKVDVYLVNNDAGTSNKLSYTYEGSNPKITRVFPKTGKMQGGDTVELRGSGFATSAMDVYNGKVDNGINQFDSKQMVAVRFGSLTNRNIDRQLENSGRIDNKRTTVRFSENNMTFEYDASGTNTKLTMTKVVDDKIYKAVINGYDNTVKYIPLKLMKDAQGNSFEGIGLVRVELEDGRLLIDTGYSENVRYVDSNQIFVTTPTYHTIGTNIPIELINPDKGKATATFEYMNPYDYPVISSIEPINKVLKSSSGLVEDYEGTPKNDDQEYYTYVGVNGGILLTIKGSNFKRTAKVYLDDKELQILDRSTNGDSLLVVIPPADESEIGLKKPITVDNKDGGVTSTREPNEYYKMGKPYFVVYQKGLSGPVIESVIPDKTSSRGQNTVTIIGSDFRPGLKVFIGGIQAEVLEIEGTEKIKVKVPLGLTAGKVSVMVQNSDYGSDEKKDALTIISSPEIQELLAEDGSLYSSDTFRMTGGENIIIKGIEFQQGARVIFGGTIKDKLDSGETGIQVFKINDEEAYVVGGTQTTATKVEDGIMIYVTTPSMSEGSSTIIVINPDGGVSEEYKITVIRPLPDRPSNAKATPVDGDTVKLEWTGSAEIYQIYASFGEKREAKELNNFNYIMTVEPEFTEKGKHIYYLRGLIPDTWYAFRIYSVNDFGVSQQYAQTQRVKTLDKVHSEAKYNNEYINPNSRMDWTESTKDKFVYNVGEKSLQEASQYYQIELRNKNIESGVSRQVKIPVKLIQNYSKNYTIWDKDVSIKFHTNALATTEIMSINTDYDNAAAIIELSSPTGKRYDEILMLLNRRTKPVKLIGIDFKLQVKDKTTDIRQFKEPIEATIVLDSKYANAQNLELYYYDVPSNKLEMVDFTKETGEKLIETILTRPGQYVIVSY